MAMMSGKQIRIKVGFWLFLLAFTATAEAGIQTVPGQVRITPGPPRVAANQASLIVTIPYAGDEGAGNTKNEITVQWGVADYTNTQSIPAAHSSPVTLTLGGLSNDEQYRVKVTFADADGIAVGGAAAVQELTEIVPYNTLIHNAVSTGSGLSKWSTAGWGTADADSQYGEFTCATCHQRNSSNIKRIRQALPAGFPVGSAPVTFSDANDNPTGTGFGDDADRAANRICEACHSKNSYHNHALADNLSNTHQNATDCTRCHRHREGFKGGGCDGCHGGGTTGASAGNYWPDSASESTDTGVSANDAGEHAAHMSALAARVYGESIAQLLTDTAETSEIKQKTLCAYCHPNPGADADHADGDNAEVAFLRIWDGAVDSAPSGTFNYNYSTPATATCSNLDCHNNKTTAPAYGWYAGGLSNCLMCHTDDGSNGDAFADPASGLHVDQGGAGVTAHDGSFGTGGTCISCHAATPTDKHLDGTTNTPATATFQFSGIDVRLGTLSDATDATCAAACHSDGGSWYRQWSADAFDTPAGDWTTSNDFPGSCKTCHGVFGAWAEGTSHAGTSGEQSSVMGSSHNSQGAARPGAACEDCHVYPSRADLHEDGAITLNDAANEVDPIRTTADTADYIYCQACHDANLLPPESESRAYPESQAFSFVEVNGGSKPVGGCFSGIAGCHGDTTDNWWPKAPSSDPSFYPNRAGAHPQHNVTIGRLLAQARTGDPNAIPIQEDYNNTCKFCHPMKDAGGVMASVSHKNGATEVFGVFAYPGADGKGVVLDASNPATTPWGSSYDTNPDDGFIYQLENLSTPAWEYPLDKDGSYRQFLYAYRGDAAVNHGTCSNIACHSNSPFTPQWYGDEQPPGAIGSLAAYTHDPGSGHQAGITDRPGTVLLTWVAPGDNGDLDGTAYEYEVYYSTAGPITSGNLALATRAGEAPTILRRGSPQRMVVDGLTPGTPNWFAVRAKDQPRYDDLDQNGSRETFVHDGLYSPLATTASAVAAHVDDVPPIFWGLDFARSHDSGGAVNLSWDAARDHTLPIVYRVYWSEYSLKTHLARGGTLPAPDANAYAGGVSSVSYAESPVGGAPTAPGGDYTIYLTTTRALRHQVTGLASGILYNFLVRAQDAAAIPNVDANRVVAMALPARLPQEPTVTNLYLMSGTNTLVLQADPTLPDWGVGDDTVQLTGTGSVTFTAGTPLNAARPTWVQGVSFAMQVKNDDRKLPQRFSIQLGYNDGTFRTLGPPIDVGIGRRASRVMNIGLSAAFGQVPAGARMAVQIKRTTTSGSTLGITFSWGSGTTKGQILFNAQPVNRAPSKPVIQPLSRETGGYVQVRWNPSTNGGDGAQTLRYDLYGSCNGGASWPYVIGLGLKDADAATGVRWDTVGDGITGGIFNCQVKVEADDGFLYETTPGSKVWLSHTASDPAAVTLDNSRDDEAPAAPTIHHIETRPKQGTVYLEWIAVGNDGLNHGSRAAYYDIRFREAADGALNESTWNHPQTVQVQGAPVPAFSGMGESFEVLNMAPDTDYTVAMRACDKGEDNVILTVDDNCSPLSPVASHTSGQYYCGICHSTPPDEPDTRGTHRQHGYTLEDCAKCHGDGTSPDGNDVRQYDGRHYDGVINIGWARDAAGNLLTLAELGLQTGGAGVTFTQGGIQIYRDPDGAGGYNAGTTYNPAQPLANTDSGSCMNFIGANASGCHGPFEPKWESDTIEVKKEPHCADCHGANGLSDPSARNLDPYGRSWDDSAGGIPSDQVKASPPVANHGGTTTSDRYVGAHERHLNASFRFAKGDSCRLCHKETIEAGLHADLQVDIRFDVSADKSEAEKAFISYDQVADGKGISCGNLNNTYCHDTGARWAEPEAKCNECHGMAGKAFDPVSNVTGIGHVMGSQGDVVPCTYCHPAGHPQSPDGITPGDPAALLINNNPAVGINYRSGGIHLKRDYPWGTYSTLAEICWGCHGEEISEWGPNTQAATGNSTYDYGSLDQTSWVGAIWSSKYSDFAYKTGRIQSIHTANPTGTSQVVWNAAMGRYDETPDPVEKIRCSNCHDVHDLNLAPGDTMTGAPYLRGTWMGNPYEEDGAPWSGRTYAEPQDGAINYTFGAVPRGGTGYDQLGGFYIDQNNVVPGTGVNANPTPAHYPTSGWTLKSSAGLCVLCHGEDVDSMDQRTPTTDTVEENLWLGTNGHSNSALGGSFSAGVNIFDYSHGRPAPVFYDWGGGRPNSSAHFPVLVPDMAFLYQGENALAGGGYRGEDANAGRYNPMTTDGAKANQPYAFNGYDWGATVDADTIDQMYHQFSCSKCHNPHASRLPKLMITNCLDIRHNTWDDDQTAPFLQNTFTAAALSAVDRNMPAAYYAAAQNCHRYDGRRADTTLRGGWNKVTPWTHDNLNDVEHKGSLDPAYVPRSGN